MSRNLQIGAIAAAALSLGMSRSFGEQLMCEHRPNTRLANLPHIDTPKPLSKRAKRRLRGKKKGTTP